jgi:uncharacterized protein (TIGR02996 family)
MATPPRNRELEAAIVNEPESPDAFLVYGDWLLEMGEPLGELVSVQAALAKVLAEEGEEEGGGSPKAMMLRQREAAILSENEKNWIGHFRRYDHTWSFGFLESIKLNEPDRGDCIDVLELTAARFLRELEIELLGHRAFENSEVVSALAEVGLPPILRKLVLAPRAANARAVDIGNVRSLWARLVRLKELVIRAGNVTFGTIDLPMVEKVTFTTNPTPEMINALTRAVWPKLQELRIELTEQMGYRMGQPFDINLFEPLIISLGQRSKEEPPDPKQTALTHFTLSGHFGGDALVEILTTRAPELLESPSLVSLDLSRAGMTDAGAQALITSTKKLARLTKLDLSGNYFSVPVATELKKAFGEERVIVADQTVNYYAGGYGGADDGDGDPDDDEDASAGDGDGDGDGVGDEAAGDE